MALHKTSHAKGVIPVPVAVACEVVSHRAKFSVAAGLALGDIILMTFLPAGHVPVDVMVDSDDLGSTGDVSVGLLNADRTDIDTVASGGAAWITSGDVNAAAGGIRADAAGLRALSRVAPDQDSDRAVGIKIAEATTATSGEIGLTILYRAA